MTICLDLSATDQDASGGTYDNSDVTGWGYGTTKLNLAGTSSNLNYFQRVFIFDTEKGGARLPYFDGTSNFDDALSVVQGSSYTNKIGAWLTKSGSSFFIPIPFSFGDGSSAINFDDQGVSVVSPSNNESGQENFRLTNNSMRVYLDTRDNVLDSVTLSGSYVWGVSSPWDFNISNQSQCLLSGNFSGMGDFTMGSSVIATGVFSLASGSKVIVNGATIDNINVNSDVDLQGSTVTTLTGVNISGVLNFDTSGTYTLINCSVNEVSNSSSGLVTIISVQSSIITNTGPDITITSSSTLTLTGLQNNSEVRVYESGTTDEVGGVENSGTSESFVLSVNSVDVVIHHLDYEYIRIEGVITTSDSSIPIQQRFDRNYENPA